METQRSSLLSRDLETQKKDLQLRVTPSEVKFLDALAGRVYRLPITIHNVGRNSQKIRLQEPVKPQVTHPGVFRAGPTEACVSDTPHLRPTWAPTLPWGGGT